MSMLSPSSTMSEDAGSPETHRVKPSTASSDHPHIIHDALDPHQWQEMVELLSRGLASPVGSLEAPSVSGDGASGSFATLTVVHGPAAGRRFALRGEPKNPERGWVIGRGDDVEVPLDRDPYVSRQAGDIEQSGETFYAVDLRTAKRRLSVNGLPLDRGERKALGEGDLIGAGRSVLEFHR